MGGESAHVTVDDSHDMRASDEIIETVLIAYERMLLNAVVALTFTPSRRPVGDEPDWQQTQAVSGRQFGQRPKSSME